MGEVITIAQPATLLKWHRQLIANKWNFASRSKLQSGRPRLSDQIAAGFARENSAWSYRRLVGAVTNLGHTVSYQTVANILKQYGLGLTYERKRQLTWAEFIRRRKDVLWATDFFTTEVWAKSGLTTYFVLFFIHLKTRQVTLVGVTLAPNEAWLIQVVRNVTSGAATHHIRYLIHDRDPKFTESFDRFFMNMGIEPLKLPPQSPNLNAFAERWVRSIQEECLDQLILFGERSLRHAINEYLVHYHHERNHQGLDNVIPLPDSRLGPWNGNVIKVERLGGLLNFYYREAA